jgi:hypothetical protein
MEENNALKYKEAEHDNNSIKSESVENSEDVSVEKEDQEDQQDQADQEDQEEGPAIYGNNINGNNWMKDYNKDYPLKLGDREYPTIEHYLQYRRYCYVMGTKHCQYFYEKIVSNDFSSYYELISYVNDKLPCYKGTTEALQEVYNLLYEDYILARFVKATKYEDIKKYLHKMNKKEIVPRQVIDCNKSTSSMEDEEIEHLKITLMHIHCNEIKGNKKDPWLVVQDLQDFIVAHTNDV